MKKFTKNFKLEIENSQKGFTLVELLVVIGILGVLAAAVLTAINPQAQLAKARDSTRKSGIRQIQGALETYKIAYGTYPPITTGTWLNSNQPGWQTFLGSELKSVPVDPTQNCSGAQYPFYEGYPCYWYSYYSPPNGSYYDLVAVLENKNDLDRCELKQWNYVGAGPGVSWCGSYSRYIYAPTH